VSQSSTSASVPSHSASTLMIGVSGIRGVVGESLTADVAMQFVQAYAAYLQHTTERPRVLVARDTRPTGETIHHLVLGALLSSGCDVVDLGIVTTPTLQLAVPFHNAQGAICITASHNPIEWNALKFFQPSGMYLDKAQGSEVIRLYDEKKFRSVGWQQIGRVKTDNEANARHIEAVFKLVDVEMIRSKKFHVVLDGCNGAGNVISPRVLDALGCRVSRINDKLDGHFTHNPEPLNENMVELMAEVKRVGADIGFAHDADADRVAIVTNEGEPCGEDFSLVWAVAHVLKNRRQGPVVTNLSTTMAVDTVANQYGCEVVRTPVGDINVSTRMRDIGAVIGGEGNGGVIIPEVQFGRDGIAAIALTLEFLAKEGQTAQEIHRSLPRYFNIKSTIQFPRERIGALFSWLKSKEKTARLDEQDGLKFEWPKAGATQSWVHIRPSGTEPFVRVICEAQTQAEAQRIQKTMREEIESLSTAW
jgi:phosphomannomutase